MTFEIGVLVLHGMGEQTETFANALRDAVVGRLGQEAARVCWKPALWAQVLQGQEERLLAELSAAHRLDYTALRRFVIHALGDAVAYQRVPSTARFVDVYEAVHDVVARCLHELREETRTGKAPGDPEVPLVVVAHSLGAHIASNHIWDLQRVRHPRQPVADNPFEKAETLAGLVTMGCNMPLYTLAYNNLIPIQFPAPTLARCFPADTSRARLKEAACWLNLFDRDDVLGYPLKPLSDAYDAAVSEDRQVNVGGICRSWNPLSHAAYWTGSEVSQAIATLIRGLLELR